QRADSRGVGGRGGGGPGDRDRRGRPHHRRAGRGAPPTSPLGASTKSGPATPVPQHGLIAMARVPAPARPLLPRRRIDLRRIATADFPLKLTAVLIALIFWIVSILSAPATEVVKDYGGRVAVERPDSVPAGYVVQGQLGDVSVRLKGTEAALANVVASDLHATLDLPAADIHDSDPQDVPVRVEVATAGVSVESR